MSDFKYIERGNFETYDVRYNSLRSAQSTQISHQGMLSHILICKEILSHSCVVPFETEQEELVKMTNCLQISEGGKNSFLSHEGKNLQTFT